MTLNGKIKVLLTFFFAVSGCDSHFRSELRRYQYIDIELNQNNLHMKRASSTNRPPTVQYGPSECGFSRTAACCVAMGPTCLFLNLIMVCLTRAKILQCRLLKENV